MMKKIIGEMFEDKNLVLNTKTVEEAKSFTDAYTDILASLELIDEEYLDDFRIGDICYHQFNENTCFTLNTGLMQYADINYFKNVPNSKIVIVDDFILYDGE